MEKQMYTLGMRSRNIQFDKDSHSYRYEGRSLTGITGIVAKRLSKDFSKATSFVEEYTDFGRAVHDEVEDYVKNDTVPKLKASKFIVDYLESTFSSYRYKILSEVLVSDYSKVASAIDLVVYDEDNNAYLFDIKTGNFDREYCSWQLGIYQYLLEIDSPLRVEGCFVISTKDSFVYRIIPKTKERCKALIANAK